MAYRRFGSLPLLAMVLAAPALAQDLQDRAVPPPPPGAAPPPATEEEVTFSAGQLDYDDNSEVVTATGDVRMIRAGNRLRADKVSWNRRTGEVRASGDVAVINPGGDVAYGDDVVLKDTLKDGVVENMLLVLQDGGRLAARRGTRTDGVTTLDRAAYTPCAVVDSDGCPKEPTWKITAVRIVHDPVRHRISYKGARFSFLGAPIFWLPGFSHPDGSQAAAGTAGLLVPDFQFSRANGIELALPYYLRLAPNRDLTLTPHVYSKVLPALDAQYRALTATGAWQARGFVTYGSRQRAVLVPTPNLPRNRGVRGFIDANGTFQPDPRWTLSGQARYASDRTVLRRYLISSEDRLRSTLAAERITPNSLLEIRGWVTQTLRANNRQGQQPVALPLVDYRRRLADPWLGGTIELQGNSLALTRGAGQDTQRAFAGARWDLRRLTTLGQEVTLTAYARGDVYHTSDLLSTITPSYRGRRGWSTRGIAALSADMRWPLIAEIGPGTQQVVPRVQVVASPPIANLRIPNEDARSVDLEDSNLFALNRFAGYDRWEDSSRITYGGEYMLDLPRFAGRAIIGQSYRLSDKPSILPPGTGLSGRWSDIVGRVNLRYGRFVQFTQRFRVDKDSLAVRRNEVDLTLGSSRTYVVAGYLRLDRNISTRAEDLRDREEARLGARLQFARYWAVFGSTTIDLTGRGEDPSSLADGYEPVRHRLGLQYDDDCIQIGLTWRRDYDPTGGARRGSTFALKLALRNVGR